MATKVVFFRRKHGELVATPAVKGLDVEGKSKQAGRATARNVVKIAREFHQSLMRPEVKGYGQIAEQFGVTKVSVSYYLSVLLRLPEGFVQWLGKCDDSEVLAYFTEHRLRPITRLPRLEQIRWLRKAASQLGGTESDVDELIELLRVDERQFSRPDADHTCN